MLDEEGLVDSLLMEGNIISDEDEGAFHSKLVDQVPGILVIFEVITI